jgi:hypothetical protein
MADVAVPLVCIRVFHGSSERRGGGSSDAESAFGLA